MTGTDVAIAAVCFFGLAALAVGTWGLIDLCRETRAQRRHLELDAMRLLATGPKYMEQVPRDLRPAVRRLGRGNLVVIAGYGEFGEPTRLLCALTGSGHRRLSELTEAR